MTIKPQKKLAVLAMTSALSLALLPLSATAGGNSQNSEDFKALKSEVEALRAEMTEMRKLLKAQNAALKTKAAPEISKAEVEKLKKDVKKISKIAKSAEEWKNTKSKIHLAGFASAGYTDKQSADGRFDQVQFSPIFHYQYSDIMLLESELEFKMLDNGETEVGLDYLTIDLLLNDYATLVVGKFLSPLGQFRQNIHPSWINKLPSAPSGFGHDAAAPLSEVGLQVRGAIPTGGSDIRANYAAYIGNGPELELDIDEIEGIEAGGFGRDIDNNKVIGGRIGIIPIPKLEIGISGATGDVALTSEADRSYSVMGADFAYQIKSLELRGEFMQQKIGSLATSAATDSSTWKAWYLQAAYKLPSNFEGVLRYADYNTPHASQDQEQWTVGLNYLFAPQALVKVAYEFNDGLKGSSADGDRFMGQLAYGF